MTTFTWSSQSASKKQEPKVFKSAYGEGYEQRVGASLNPLTPEWSLTFVRQIADARSIDAFLAARGGTESFDWTDPDGHTIRAVCDVWSYSPTAGMTAATVTATFRQVHE